MCRVIKTKLTKKEVVSEVAILVEEFYTGTSPDQIIGLNLEGVVERWYYDGSVFDGLTIAIFETQGCGDWFGNDDPTEDGYWTDKSRDLLRETLSDEVEGKIEFEFGSEIYDLDDLKISASVGSLDMSEETSYNEVEFSVTKDDEEVGTCDGWIFCGYIARGASGDIDGSGLALWGDSQPGGWTSHMSDGGGTSGVDALWVLLCGLTNAPHEYVHEFCNEVEVDVDEPADEEIFDFLDKDSNVMACSDDECVVRVGKCLGVDILVTLIPGEGFESRNDPTDEEIEEFCISVSAAAAKRFCDSR